MKPNKSRHYTLSVFILLVLALVLGSQPLAAAYPIAASLDLFSRFLDVPTFQSPAYVIGCAVLLGLIALGIYVLSLNPFVLARAPLVVFLNGLTPGLFLAATFVANDYGSLKDYTEYSKIYAPLVALGPPILLVIFERLGGMILRALGGMAQGQGIRRPAIVLLKGSLALVPGHRDTRRRCGLLYLEDDEFTQSIKMLEPLGPIETSEDEERLRALDQCYRQKGKTEAALACLQRLRALRPDAPNLDRRILDDFIKLGQHQEALDLLESGRIKQNMDLLLMRQWLYVEQGNFAQAMHQIRRIADQEGPPYAQSIRLYRDLLERLPDHLEVKINLGLLLLLDDAKTGREEGAELLEQALAQDPRRLHLARHLVRHYAESGDVIKQREHLKRLVAAGDPNPEFYLEYAQMFLDEEQLIEAVRILTRMVEILPDNWRGHHRLAKAYFQMDELDQADAELITAAALAPEESDSAVRSLRTSIEQRRRERMVLTLAADVAQTPANHERRLDLIDQMIGMEWIDKALAQCDELLDEAPDLSPAIITRLEGGLQQVAHGYRLRDYLADLYFEQGQYDETLRLYREMAEQSLHPMRVLAEGCEKILSRAPDHVEARRELALIRRNQEDWPAIVETLDPLLRNGVLPAEDKALWVEAAYRLRRLADAARVGLSLVDDLAAETGFMLMLIDILQDNGEFDRAEEVFYKAKAAAPDHDRLKRIEKRVITSRKKHRLEALEKRWKETGALTAAEHFEKAQLHQDLEEIQEAIVHYQRAADERSMAGLALAKMAVTLCERGMYDLAYETLDPVELTREEISEHPELKELFYLVARALEKVRQPEKAVRFYKRIFRLDASYEDVVERIDRLT